MNDELEKFPMLMKLCISYKDNDNDNFYKKVKRGLQTEQGQLLELDSNLGLLDSKNFDVFRDEVLTKGNKDEMRVYSSLTDRFNELKGFRYLLEKGFTNIHFIPPSRIENQKTPDLEATCQFKNDTVLEIKTVNNSDEEVDMLMGTNDSVRQVLNTIPEALVNQIKKEILCKKIQIDTYNRNATNKIILMIIKLDIGCLFTDKPILHMQETMIEIAKESLPFKLVWLLEGFDSQRINKLSLSGFQEL